MNNENNFIENCFNHTLHVYIDIAGDLVAGTLLSQIMYWFSPDKNGDTKLRVKKKDGMWLAKSRTDWYEEIRISPKQYDRAIKVLKSKGLVETKLYRFNGYPTNHIRPVVEKIQALSEQWQKERAANVENITIFPKGKNPISPKGKIQFDERVKTLTENTTETTNKDYTHIGRSDTETQGGVVPYKKFEWNSWSQYNDYVDNKLKDDIYDIATEEELGIKETRKLYSLFRRFFLMHIEQGKGRHSIIQKPKLETIINRLYATDYICDGEGLDERGIFECMIRFFQSNRKNDYSIYIFTESSTLNGLIGKVYGTGGEMYEEINQKRGVGYR